MTLSVEKIAPHLGDINSGKTTQRALAAALGVSQPALSKFMKRHGMIGDDSPGKGGRHPSTTDEMLEAVKECENPKVNIRKVADKYGIKYPALAKRVKKRRDKLAEEKALRDRAEREALLAQIPAKHFPQAEFDGMFDEYAVAKALAENPDKVIALAKALRELGL